jgi:aspartate kinase
MVRVVQKYGGTSVANVDRMSAVATRIGECAKLGNEIIVVVSARAGMTNDLLRRASEVSKRPDAACLDALLCIGECETAATLAIILNDIGVSAVFRNAYQAGIVTCSTFGNARIVDILGGDVEDCLKNGQVVVVTGFQGVDGNMCPTTLGRGGSDLTALALAYRFGADSCEIYSDVNGVFSGDPRVIDRPNLMETMSHDFLLELTFLDNKVMQDRSVAFAKEKRVDFSITSSFNKNSGGKTRIIGSSPRGESSAIALTHKTGLVLISTICEGNIFDKCLKFFAENRINASFVRQTKFGKSGKFFVEIALAAADYSMLRDPCFDTLLPQEFSAIENLTRVDIVGAKLEHSPWLDEVLSFVKNQGTFRSEYGKSGLSFLIETEDYKVTLNGIHSIVFG